MASLAPIPQPQSFLLNRLNKPISNFTQFTPQTSPSSLSLISRRRKSRNSNPNHNPMVLGKNVQLPVAHAAPERPLKSAEEEKRGFVEEMRAAAMKLHTREQAREGEKQVEGPEDRSPAKWDPSVEGYLRFLVDSKLVFGTLEKIVDQAPVPYYAEFRNTGLERSESLAKDLKWFKEQGYTIPEPSTPGLAYASCLEELAKKDPQAFICHFYNVYFAHSAGGRMIGRKVTEKILSKKELEFYKWDGDLRQLLQNVRDKLNLIADNWTREEKNHCLEETEKSFKLSGQILRLILT